MTKKRRGKKRTHNKKSNKRYYTLFGLLVTLFLIFFALIFYLVEEKLQDNSQKINSTQSTLQDNSQKIKELQKLLKTKEAENSRYLSEIDDLNETLKSLDYQNVQKRIKYKKSTSKKPKLAIIIDDVTNKIQVNKIQRLPYRVTMSFLPPTERFPNSDKAAQGVKHMMIHLPLEALSFNHSEPDTLLATDSIETIRTRVQELHQKFPNAHFTNNHTGSKFTSDIEAMKRLLKVLHENGLEFVDSRTTPASKAVEAAEYYNEHIFVRDTFLDNNLEVDYIHNQIKSAVERAKKNGYAIAICHPHSVTLEALNSARGILKDVELVYINQI